MLSLSAQVQDSRTEGSLGYAYQVSDRLQLAFGHQSGPENSVTAGFTYNLTPILQVIPALHVANTAPLHLMGCAVLTWNLPVEVSRGDPVSAPLT